MKAFLRPLFLGALAASLGFFTACDKSESDIRPTINTPQTGSLSGQVRPASAVTSVTAWSTAERITVIPNEKGEYHFKELTAGKWSIHFDEAPGYAWTNPEDARVTVGTTSKVAPVLFEATIGLGGWWLIDGKYTGLCIVTTYYNTPDKLIFIGSSTNTTMEVNLIGFNASPLSFPLGKGGSSSKIIYRTFNTEGIAEEWISVEGSGSVKVSVYGTNPRRVSGTFTCQIVPANKPTAASKQISCEFSNVKY